MLDIWFKQAKAGWPARREKFRRQFAKIPPPMWGGGILIFAFLLAAARPVWNFTHRPDDARLDAIAEEVGSFGFMIRDHRPQWFGADAPLINHAGTQILFCQTSENGAAVFTLDLATGEKKQLFEEFGNRFSPGPATALTAYDWSPDDTKIIFTRQGPTPAWELVVAEAATGRELATLEIFRVRKAVWLTPKSFVCTDQARAIHWIREQADKSWKEIIPIAGEPAHGKLRLVQRQVDGTAKDMGTISVNGQYDGLTALSTNKIAWQEGNQIVAFDLSAKTATVLLKLPDERLKEFSYSPANGQFLLSCTTNGRDSLWRLMPGEETLQESNLMATANENVRLWFNDGKGFVYFNQAGQLRAQTNAASESKPILPGGHIGSLAVTPDGKRLVIFGAASNEPACGVWEYDLAANTARCLVPAAGRGLQHVLTGIRTQHRLFPVRGGHWFDLDIFKPIPFDRHRQYPLVIANTPFSGAEPYLMQYALAVQNAGGYFVDIDRRDWSDTNGTQEAWAENAAYVVNLLIQDPTIDRRRIFLISNCVESRWLGIYAAKYPWRGRGMFMLVGNTLPDPASLAAGKYPSKIFDSACDAWEGNGDRLKKYQETAAQSGVQMDYLVHKNTMHDFISQQSQRDRTRALLHLVFEQ